MGGQLTRTNDLRTLLTLGSIGALNDGALLDLFETRRGGVSAADRAFETLVGRHGGMVLRVARGRLGSEEDARDAFQATFWILARRSRTIRDRDALAAWLFGVASRVAARSVVEAARRRDRERRAATPVEDSSLDPARPDRDLDLAPTIQDEIRRLPEKYRVAVILCDLEGLSNEEAAARLACPSGTLKARLSRGRARLRTRLADRGFAPSSWQSTPPPRPLVVPVPLIQAACRMALPATSISSTLSLAQGASRTMLLSSISPWAAVASATLAAGAVAVIAMTGLHSDPTSNQAPGPAPAAAAKPNLIKPVENILQNAGFEAGDQSPSYWSEGAEIDGVKYLWDQGNGQRGKASLCLQKTAQRYFPIAQWYQVVDRKGDEPALRVTAQVKADRVTKAIIDVMFLDEKGESISHEWAGQIGNKGANAPPTTHDWKEYASRVEIPKATKKIQVGLQIYGPGKVWFDEVRAEYAK